MLGSDPQVRAAFPKSEGHSDCKGTERERELVGWSEGQDKRGRCPREQRDRGIKRQRQRGGRQERADLTVGEGRMDRKFKGVRERERNGSHL